MAALKRILTPLDGSPLAEESLSHAIQMARAFSASLLLLQVLDVSPALAEHCPESLDWRLRRLQAQRYLESLADRFSGSGIEIECHLAEGRPAECIVEFAREHAVGLVVLSAFGWGGVSGFQFGGTALKVVSAAGISCAVIQPGDSARLDPDLGYQRILVPLDGSQQAEWAVGMASALVDATGGELIVLQVVSAPEMPRRRPLTREEAELRNKLVECNRLAAAAYLDEVRTHAEGSHRVRTRLVVSPNIVETIHRIADQESVDLIAMAARGASSRGDRNYGSISQSVLFHSTRPVLVFQDSGRSTLHAAIDDPVDFMERKICATGSQPAAPQ